MTEEGLISRCILDAKGIELLLTQSIGTALNEADFRYILDVDSQYGASSIIDSLSLIPLGGDSPIVPVGSITLKNIDILRGVYREVTEGKFFSTEEGFFSLCNQFFSSIRPYEEKGTISVQGFSDYFGSYEFSRNKKPFFEKTYHSKDSSNNHLKELSGLF